MMRAGCADGVGEHIDNVSLFPDVEPKSVDRGVRSLAAKLRARGVLLAIGLSFCFVLSWLASEIGLAAIVGAFAAGLLLEDTHYQEFVGRGERGLEELVHPISSFLARPSSSL